MKRKFRLVVPILSLGLILSITGILWLHGRDMRYNKNPDVSGKVVGSNSMSSILDRERARDVGDLLALSDLVVVGEVVSDGIDHIQALTYPEFFPSKELEEKAGSPTYTLSVSTIRVKQVLVGNSSQETFDLTQMGTAGNDLVGETKVKRGETYVFFLRENEEEAWAGSYSSVACEDGIFQVFGNGTVLSLTDNLHLAIYDDRSMDLLLRDLDAAVKQGVK